MLALIKKDRTATLTVSLISLISILVLD